VIVPATRGGETVMGKVFNDADEEEGNDRAQSI
jgi:hypothetical protein